MRAELTEAQRELFREAARAIVYAGRASGHVEESSMVSVGLKHGTTEAEDSLIAAVESLVGDED